MNRNFGIGILIICFGSSTVNLAMATESMEVPPVVVQPYEIQELNQQMMDRDRQNRDEEIAIKGLVDENNKLTQDTLARQDDEGLKKINQTMLSYRNAIISRDQTRIAANSEKWSSRYGDLVALTEDTDAITVHQDLESRSGLLAEKYQMLTALKDEMTALNEKLKGENGNTVNQNETIIDGYKKVAQQQQEKIQMLVDRLSEMDKRISHFDEIIAQKDQQIARLKDNLAMVQSEASNKEETIKEQENQISILKGRFNVGPSSSVSKVELPPVIVNSSNYHQQEMKENQSGTSVGKIDLPPILVSTSNGQQQAVALASPAPVIPPQYEGAEKDEIIREKQNQVDLLKSELENKIAEENNQGHEAQRIQRLDADLRAKDDTILWLNKVLAVVKDKAKYYQLTSQEGQAEMKQVQGEVQRIKDDFAQHFSDYDRFEKAIIHLKSELKVKTLKDKRQEKQIVKMKADILAILQAQADKEIYHAKVDARIQLARQLIDLQDQEASLLEEKSNLEAAQNDLFEKRTKAIEDKINALLDRHDILAADLQNRLEELKGKLNQKEQDVRSLKEELEKKITQEKNQIILTEQIHDYKTQLQEKEDQITAMKSEIQSGKQTQSQVDGLKDQLAQLQSKADSLKQELDSKNAQSEKMTVMMEDYQSKLESKNNDYNQQLGQIADLNSRLQDKEMQVIKIKKEMYDLQDSANNKERDVQERDLNLSMIQQKVMEDKIKEYQEKIDDLQATNEQQVQEVKKLRVELAMAQQKLEGMPSSDEIIFLRSGLTKAVAQLKEKDDRILKIKANADEYSREFKAQTQEFQSLKDQLLYAQKEIGRKDEDLKYKDLALIRLKQLSLTSENELKAQVKVLTQKIAMFEKGITKGKPHGKSAAALEVLLQESNDRVKELEAELHQFQSSSKNDPIEAKLKQALNKIDEQGRVINILVQKLQNAGQNVDLTHEIRE